jgi:SAM-dependent methyltransferase
MNNTFETLRKLYAGQSLARVRMNQALASYTLRGRVLDVRGGHSPDYFQYFIKISGTTVEAVDGSMSTIDFEKQALPFADGYADTVILCNVLEHIYNHVFLLGEVRRVLAPGGQLIGFVPFWTGYHPDPHDYFRYTHEALERMLAEAGFPDVTVSAIGAGPLLANFNTIVLSLPRFVRPAAYLWYAAWDAVFLKLRPFGYIFTSTIAV